MNFQNVVSAVQKAAGIPSAEDRAFLEAYWRRIGWGSRGNHPFISGAWDDYAKRNLEETQRRLGLPVNGRWDASVRGRIEAELTAASNIAAVGVAAYNQAARPGFGGPMGGPSITFQGGPGISGAPAAPGWSPPRSPEDIRAFIYNNYGYFAGFMNEPEIGALLTEAATNNWDVGRLQGALYNTSWWKNKSANEREWIRLQNEDPASADRKRQERKAALDDLQKQIGLRLPADLLQNMTEDALRLGLSDAELRNMLATHINIFTTWNEGMVQTIFNKARDLGGEYFVKTSDDRALQFAVDIVRGDYAEADMAGWFRDQAKSKYAHLASALDQGVTMKQYFDPHRAQIADLLEVSGEGVDFMNDNRWAKVITTTDASTGQVRAMTLGEVADYTRSLDAWKTTKNARASAAEMGTYLMETFGEIAR